MAVTQNELITALQTLLSTNPVRLAMRSGLASELDLADLLVGEIAVATDTLQVWVCTALGTCIQITGGLTALGYYATSGDLSTAHPTGTAGDIYIVGSAPSHLYTWGESEWVDLGAYNDTSTFAANESVLHITGDETKTGGLEITKGIFATGFDATALPADKNGVSAYWNTTTPIGGVTGGVGRIAAFIKTASAIVYKALGLGAYVGGKFALLLDADGSAKFGGAVTLNADPTAALGAATKSYVDRYSPVGEIKIWPTASAPVGFLLCNGTLISRTTYAELFAVLGTSYGAGNGSTTFALPDLRGRIVAGKTASGTFSTLGVAVGSETVALTEAQNGPHFHGFSNLYLAYRSLERHPSKDY